jgi:hypothetical protein
VVVVLMAMTVFVRVTADFDVATADSASTFLAHKICSGSSGRQSAPSFCESNQCRLTSAAAVKDSIHLH